MFLLESTRFVNYILLASALWLGLYVVTRGPRRLISWLTGLMLWSIASLALNVLLAINPPPEPAEIPGLFRLLTALWYEVRVERALSGWVNGWSVTPTIVLWHHITTLMRPGALTTWRWIRILIGYAVLIAAVLIQAFTPLLFTLIPYNPLFLPSIEPGSLYGYFALALFYLISQSLVNLIRSARAAPTAMPRKQFLTLATATVIAGLSGPVSIAGSLLGFQAPMIFLSIVLTIAVFLIGFGVARYSALMAGRTIWRDFVYNGMAVTFVTFLYILVTWLSVTAYRVPGVAFIFIFMLAIITHSLVDVGRRGFDAIFYRQSTSSLRANLQHLVALAGEQDSLNEKLTLILDSMCASVRATFGVLVIFEADQMQVAATYRWPRTSISLPPQDLAADDFLTLEPGHFPEPLSDAALLIPLYADTLTDQLGTLLLGRPSNGLSYSEEDLELLNFPSDRLAAAIYNAKREASYLTQVAELVEENKRQAAQVTKTEVMELAEVVVKDVEKAFRNLSDYADLGRSPLTKLKLTVAHLPAGTVTHVDRGKAVYNVLVKALNKLRPDSTEPDNPPGREWYPYLILKRAYIEDVPNRDIMSELYISEGTFNRTRRAALRAVTRALQELEAGVTTEPSTS